jgi:Uma2 family endonuclease
MGHPQTENKKYSLEEWVELERSREIRYEFHLGEVFAMAGGSMNHGRISRNTTTLLDNHFNDHGNRCEVLTSEIKIEIASDGRYVYPDTMAVCGEVIESETVKVSITNPVLVIEVISDSSEAYDRGQKYRFYKRLSSIKEYLIIEQDRIAATLYRRNGDGDIFSRIEFEGVDAVIALQSIDFDLELVSLYRSVNFPD